MYLGRRSFQANMRDSATADQKLQKETKLTIFEQTQVQLKKA